MAGAEANQARATTEGIDRVSSREEDLVASFVASLVDGSPDQAPDKARDKDKGAT